MSREIYNQGYQRGAHDGAQQAGHSMRLELDQTVAQLRQDFDRRLNQTAAGLRSQLGRGNNKQIDHIIEMADQKLNALGAIAQHLDGTRSGGGGAASPNNRCEGNQVYTAQLGSIRIEDIPGRRVPFSFLAQIPINNGIVGVQEDSFMIPQEGPFVAVKRMATFLSQNQYAIRNEQDGSTANFAGRSFGRFRPTSSAGDVVDSQHAAKADSTSWFLAANAAGAISDVLPSAVLAQAASASSFRTMQFDGLIEVINAGSSYPRQNMPVPSSFWSPSIQAPFELGALDFFERGEALTFKVQPTHVNNPPAGNAAGANVFPLAGVSGYPFVEGQYDPHEGIATPNAVALGGNGPDDFVPASTDVVQRLPDGILILGYEGYRIVQAVGPAL